MSPTETTLFALFVTLVTGFAHATTYKENVNYITLDDAAFSADNSVIEIYTTNCPHCYQYEKSVLPSYSEKLKNKGVNFDTYHVRTKPPFGEEKTNVLAVTKALHEDKFETVKLAYFKRLHDDKLKFKTSEETLKFGLTLAGISKEQYQDALSSEAVSKVLDQWEPANAVAKIQGVPAIVVNGKYLIQTKSIRSMDMLDDYLTQELLKK